MQDNASIDFLLNASVAQMTREWVDPETKRQCFNGGVYYQDGQVCPLGIQRKQTDNVPDAMDANGLPFRSGSYVFGGLLQNIMFGHFLVESLSRLWALDYLEDAYSTILFYKRNPNQKVHGYVKETLDLLFPTVSFEIVEAPTQFEKLAVPEQIIKPNGHIYGHPLIRKMCQRFPQGARTGYEKIFVSRSRQGEYSSNIIGESLIENYLEEEGYTIVYPEEHSIRDQIEIYSSAKKLIFSDGSAIHLYALVARPEQQVFVIYRRLGEHFGWQIRSFGGPALQGTPCLNKLWLPSNVLQHHSLAQGGKALLDMPALSSQLKEGGFISGTLWPEFPFSQAEKVMADLEENGRQKYLLLPLPEC
jgi:hypothetical protein